MKSLHGYEIRSLLAVAAVAVLVAGGGANADFAFGTPTNLGPTVNSPARDEEPGISADGLSIYYCSLRAGGYGGYDMWVTTRATTKDQWGPPVNLGPRVNSPSDDFSEDISADGLELYFGSNRPGGSGSYDIWVAKRATPQDAWMTPVNLGPSVNSSSGEGCPSVSDDGLELYFFSDRPGGVGGYDIWVSRRATKQDDWGMAKNLGFTINSPTSDLCTDVSPDGRSLILVSARAGGYGGELGDLWMVRRPEMSASWGLPVNLGPRVNSQYSENGPCLSADGSTLYFSSDRPGGSGAQDMWQVSISPVVDFNGDGIVDIKDLVLLIEHWGQDYPLCDIGPMPWGDGIIDAQDLEVLMSHWGEEPGLIAQWALDEAEGVVAFDGVGTADGVLLGSPARQPTGGNVGGALLLDGVDDHIETPFVVDPAGGPFSVFAWTKNGAPGRVLLSQVNGVNWLMLTPGGVLATDLRPSGRQGKPLISTAMVTDDAWHRVGFVWDGSNRVLYVDDTEVARDKQSNLAGSAGGLYIGTGATLAPGSFWSGLIDDVRIYDRAVEP